MSQKKVDQYKEFKKNREKIYAKEKRAKKIEVGVATAVAVLIVGWFGFSIYQSATRPAESADGTAQTTVVDYTAYDSYISGLELNYQ